jgi:hypothetical protein
MNKPFNQAMVESTFVTPVKVNKSYIGYTKDVNSWYQMNKMSENLSEIKQGQGSQGAQSLTRGAAT